MDMRLKVTTVPDYIRAAPKVAQPMLKKLRATIRAAAPKARELISYGMPFYEYRSPGFKGRMIYYAAFTTHVGVFVVPRSVPPKIATQLKKYQVSKSALRFPFGTTIPVGLVTALVKIRMREIDTSLAGATPRR